MGTDYIYWNDNFFLRDKNQISIIHLESLADKKKTIYKGGDCTNTVAVRHGTKYPLYYKTERTYRNGIIINDVIDFLDWNVVLLSYFCF